MGAQQIEGAGLAGHAPGLPHARNGERAETEPVAGDIHRVLTDKHEAEAPGEFRNGLLDGIAKVVGLRARDFVQKNFGVGCRLENMAFGFHLGTELVRVRDVAVMRDSNLPPLATHENRLRIRQGAGTRSTVTHVANARESLQFVDVVFAQQRGDKPHGLTDANLFAVGNRKAGAFLPAVLQGVEPHSDIPDDVIAIVDTDDATFFVQFLEHYATPFYTNKPFHQIDERRKR